MNPQPYYIQTNMCSQSILIVWAILFQLSSLLQLPTRCMLRYPSTSSTLHIILTVQVRVAQIFGGNSHGTAWNNSVRHKAVLPKILFIDKCSKIDVRQCSPLVKIWLENLIPAFRLLFCRFSSPPHFLVVPKNFKVSNYHLGNYPLHQSTVLCCITQESCCNPWNSEEYG